MGKWKQIHTAKPDFENCGFSDPGWGAHRDGSVHDVLEGNQGPFRSAPSGTHDAYDAWGHSETNQFYTFFVRVLGMATWGHPVGPSVFDQLG